MIKLTDILNEDCWKGYKQIGGKMKNGKMVPNCVPESVEENSINEASMTVSIANIVDELFPKEFFWVYNPQDKERVKSVIGDLVRTLNTFYKKQGIKVRFTDTNFKMKMYAKESAREDLTSSERLELYKLYSKAMKAMPQSPNQKKIIKKINVLRTKAGMKPLKEVTITEIGVFPIRNYLKGMIPSKMWNTTTPQKKEQLKSTITDLIRTLNQFWKQHNIPFRVKEGVTQNEDLRKWFGKGKTGSSDGGGWDRYSSDGKKLGKCGDGKEGGAYAACLSKEKAAKLGPKGRASFVNRKRADQKKAGDKKKGGNKTKGKTPTFSKTGA